MAQYAVSYVTGNEWVSGGADGSLQVRFSLMESALAELKSHCS
jgi:hypothetical protein